MLKNTKIRNQWLLTGACTLLFMLTSGLLFGANTACAARIEIVGIETTVSVTSVIDPDLVDFTIDLLGNADFRYPISGFPEIIFPVTGGFVDTHADSLIIEHEDSGFRLQKDAQTNGRTLYFENLLIDTEQGIVFSDTTVNMTTPSLDFPLFGIGDNLALELTSEAALLLDAAYLVGDLTGKEIGIASLDLQLVPVPGAVWLLGAALLGLVGLKRRK